MSSRINNKLLSGNAAAILLAGIIPALASSFLLLIPGIPGYDSPSHIAKAAFLMYSLSHGNFSGWSQFWYSGFQLFYTYSPLTYVVSAVLGFPFGNAMLGMKLFIILSFFLSGVGGYALARDFSSNSWSVVAGLIYSLVSPHFLMLFYTGSLTYSLAFALAPFLFLSLRAALRRRNVRSMIYFGVMIALMIISNETTCYVIFFPLVAYVIISTPLSSAIKTGAVVLVSAIIGFLLSAFWLIPYLKIDLSGQLNLLSESNSYSPSFVIHWYTFFVQDYGNANAGDVGWILLIPALLSIIFLRKREEFALYGAGVIIVLLTLGSSISPLFYKIPLVLALQFAWRFMIGDVIFLTPLAILFFYRLAQKLHFGKSGVRIGIKSAVFFIIILLVLLPFAGMSIVSSFGGQGQNRQTPSDPGQAGAYSFLSSQGGFYRVMIFDRYYESGPEYTLKGSIDGWYDQATTQAYRNYTFNIYYCPPDTRTLKALQLLGVRYVMIDYGYGGGATRALTAFESNSSVFGPPVYNNSEVTIYQVHNSQLIYVSSSFPNGEFGFSSNLNCATPIPGAPSQGNVTYTISNLNWEESKIYFDVSVNESAYLLVSNAYSSGWLATDNGSPTTIMLSPPGLPVIHVSSGTHRIILYYEGAPDAFYAGLVSLVTFVVTMVLLIPPRWKTRKSL